ncbi:hypothetical protein AMECASPLE_005846 [Ameca splendens]|uniref:Uncharacterized protein n=1 Tax=Ameca splendens TaxID=208324 RepID=A0ABV1A6E6_9TELE
MQIFFKMEKRTSIKIKITGSASVHSEDVDVISLCSDHNLDKLHLLTGLYSLVIYFAQSVLIVNMNNAKAERLKQNQGHGDYVSTVRGPNASGSRTRSSSSKSQEPSKEHENWQGHVCCQK